ncbi:hypothetical protein DFH09DRAFT_1312396 [Mycena vulgaris]|nr:hypothetical protein DFH09DRAFT_1312396 [Mycena vulgaris]
MQYDVTIRVRLTVPRPDSQYRYQLRWRNSLTLPAAIEPSISHITFSSQSIRRRGPNPHDAPPRRPTVGLTFALQSSILILANSSSLIHRYCPELHSARPPFLHFPPFPISHLSLSLSSLRSSTSVGVLLTQYHALLTFVATNVPDRRPLRCLHRLSPRSVLSHHRLTFLWSSTEARCVNNRLPPAIAALNRILPHIPSISPLVPDPHVLNLYLPTAYRANYHPDSDKFEPSPPPPIRYLLTDIDAVPMPGRRPLTLYLARTLHTPCKTSLLFSSEPRFHAHAARPE